MVFKVACILMGGLVDNGEHHSIPGWGPSPLQSEVAKWLPGHHLSLRRGISYSLPLTWKLS